MKFLLLECLQAIANLGETWGWSLDALGVSNTDTTSVPMGHSLSPGVGLVEEHIWAERHSRQLHSDRSGEPGLNVESDVDSSDDDEDLELEPALVLADIAIITASDLIHQQDSDDGDSGAGRSSSEGDCSIDI